MAECRYLRLPFVMEYAAQHFSLDIAWPEQHLGIEVREEVTPILCECKNMSHEALMVQCGM